MIRRTGSKAYRGLTPDATHKLAMSCSVLQVTSSTPGGEYLITANLAILFRHLRCLEDMGTNVTLLVPSHAPEYGGPSASLVLDFPATA